VLVIPWKNCNKQRQGNEAPEELETFNNSNNNRFHDDTSDRTPNSYETPIPSTSNHILSHIEHISMSKTIAPLWFLSNYFYAISLQYTSIASSTVLASMGSIFTFLFATCTKYGDEKVTRYKLVGVVLCFCGGVATAWTDVNGGGSSESTTATLDSDGSGRIRRILLPHIITNIEQSESVQTLLGDIAGLLSAIGYGAYTVLIRNVCPKDESRMSMQLFFGYIGVLNMIVLCPFAIWIIVSSGNNDNDSQEEVDSIDQIEDPSTAEDNDQTTTTTLTGTIFLFLILKGLLDNVLSDYLWARAVILTSATVASVGVGLTIPMAFIADYIMGNYGSDGGSIEVGDVLGALFVLSGFVFVNMNHELGDRSSRGGSGIEDDQGYDFGDSSLDVVSVDRNEAAILS